MEGKSIKISFAITKSMPPAFIPIITVDHIKLKGDISQLPQSLRYPTIVFQKESSHFENKDLIKKLLILNGANVLFAEDYTQICSPATFMRELQRMDTLKKKISAVSIGLAPTTGISK